MKARKAIEGHAHPRIRRPPRSSASPPRSGRTRQALEPSDAIIPPDQLRGRPDRDQHQPPCAGSVRRTRQSGSPHPEHGHREHRHEIPVGIPRVSRPAIRHRRQQRPESP